MSLELGERSWKLTIGDGRRGPSRYSVDAGDTTVVLDCASKARSRCGVNAEAKTSKAARKSARHRLELALPTLSSQPRLAEQTVNSPVPRPLTD
jgi:hypothetical protein